MGQRFRLHVSRIMWIVFITLWIAGNLVMTFEPMIRIITLDETPESFSVELMKVLGGIDKFYHPYYYSQLEDDFLAVVEKLPEEDTVFVLVHEDDPTIEVVEFYKRFWRVWAYPRPVIFLGEPTQENLDQTPADSNIIVLNIASLPDRTCTPEAGAFSLCH